MRAFQEAVRFLKENFGRLDPPLSSVQRLRRGDVDLGLGRGPDVLNDVEAKPDHGRLVGWSGDSYVLMVEFARNETRSWAMNQLAAAAVAA